MEGFLYTLGLNGTVPNYINLLAKGGFRTPEDLMMEEPSMDELAALGITDEEDLQKLYFFIHPEALHTSGGPKTPTYEDEYPPEEPYDDGYIDDGGYPPQQDYTDDYYPDDGQYPPEDPYQDQYPPEDPYEGQYPPEDPYQDQYPPENYQQDPYYQDQYPPEDLYQGQYPSEDPYQPPYPEDHFPQDQYPDGYIDDPYPPKADPYGRDLYTKDDHDPYGNRPADPCDEEIDTRGFEDDLRSMHHEEGPTDEEFLKMRAEYERLMAEDNTPTYEPPKSANYPPPVSPRGNTNTPNRSNTYKPATQNNPEDDEYERLKADYDRLLKGESAAPVSIEAFNPYPADSEPRVASPRVASPRDPYATRSKPSEVKSQLEREEEAYRRKKEEYEKALSGAGTSTLRHFHGKADPLPADFDPGAIEIPGLNVAPPTRAHTIHPGTRTNTTSSQTYNGPPDRGFDRDRYDRSNPASPRDPYSTRDTSSSTYAGPPSRTTPTTSYDRSASSSYDRSGSGGSSAYERPTHERAQSNRGAPSDRYDKAGPSYDRSPLSSNEKTSGSGGYERPTYDRAASRPYERSNTNSDRSAPYTGPSNTGYTAVRGQPTTPTASALSNSGSSGRLGTANRPIPARLGPTNISKPAEPAASESTNRPRPNFVGTNARSGSLVDRSSSPFNKTTSVSNLTQPSAISTERGTSTQSPRAVDSPHTQSNPTDAVKQAPVTPVEPAKSSPTPAQRTHVPIQGASITGVKLIKDPTANAQLEALKALAEKGNVSFGNELKIEVFEPQLFNGELLFSVRLITNMRQFSHLTFHRLDTSRRYVDFEELYKKLSSISNYSTILPKFPKKKEKSNFVIFDQMMKKVANDPGLHGLSCVVDFFDNNKTGPTAKLQSKSSGFFKKK